MKKLIAIVSTFSFLGFGFAQTTNPSNTTEKVVVQKSEVKPTEVKLNSKIEKKVPSKVIATKEQIEFKEHNLRIEATPNDQLKKQHTGVLPTKETPI
ncbi:MAG: hypothetical protein KDC82_08255, partial [Bacteroidetes bacterium]|nr:hypothetical protein [Bacteroidota bacterium]